MDNTAEERLQEWIPFSLKIKKKIQIISNPNKVIPNIRIMGIIERLGKPLNGFWKSSKINTAMPTIPIDPIKSSIPNFHIPRGVGIDVPKIKSGFQ